MSKRLACARMWQRGRARTWTWPWTWGRYRRHLLAVLPAAALLAFLVNVIRIERLGSAEHHLQ
eukprot:338322-Prymnesium_polylepis.3